MAVSIAMTVMAVSPLLVAHLFVSPSARRARHLRGRNEAHRRLAQLQADEVALHRRISSMLS